MEGYDATTYGQRWAAVYDDVYDEVDDSLLDLLTRHAGDPPRALELAIGSGRIAVPLSRRGVAVSGIDSSEAMVSKLRSKPGGEDIEVVMGDFGEVDVESEFPLIYLAFNTIFGLQDQESQVRCFRNVADHLEPGGRFIIDCFVPDLSRFDRHNSRLGVSSISSVDEHWTEASIYDPVTQQIRTRMTRYGSEGDTVVLPISIRFAWPSELDLMARLAGLELEDRFGWYDLRPFNERSTSHMSIYVKPD